MKEINLITEEGLEGTFTREQFKGAIPNGTKVKKVNSQANDGHQDGALATIVGSIGTPKPIEVQGITVRCAYFVIWDDMPKRVVGVSEHKLEAINN